MTSEVVPAREGRAFKVMKDVFCVVSSCPFDLAIEGWTINSGQGPSELIVDIREGEAS